MRRFAPVTSVCTLLLFATLSHAQQVDLAVGGGITLAPKSTSSSEAALPPTEKGGIYPSIGVDVLLNNGFAVKHRLGLNVETSWRYKRGSYDGYEKYRPIFTDVNALFQPKLSKKFGLDFLAGAGVASNQFYLPGMTSCVSAPGTCYTTSNHFMEHLSGGLRYYVWHRLPHVFIRPEIHYYHIQNNFEFYSGNLLRASASIGYTFGDH
ncbi:MAG: hypothetical protein WCA49_07890 [Candidatus Sulfotelmatobacter sp.]